MIDNGTVADVGLDADRARDPYRGVVALLLAAALIGFLAAIVAERRLGNVVLLDLAVSFTIASCILAGVLAAQSERERRRAHQPLPPPEADSVGEQADIAVEEPAAPSASTKPHGIASRYNALQARVDGWYDALGPLGKIRAATAVAGVMLTVLLLSGPPPMLVFTPLAASIAGAACLLATGLAALAARYLAELDVTDWPEASGLARGARVMAWLLAFAALSIALQWRGQVRLVGLLHVTFVIINLATCYSLLVARELDAALPVFQLDLGVFAVLGSRPNIFLSLVDAGERLFGIDLRSTWALTVVRRGLEPLLIGLLLLGWLSTALTVVGVEEQGLVERVGVAVAGGPLDAGLHVHFPWPIDRVALVPVRRIQTIGVGHEGEEAPGPENVIWAVEHAPNEFTLLLGNGRDLITVDAAVQYRIVDPHAWRYNSQNPEMALKVLAYRAVMKNTVNHTLTETLSENVAKLTERMRAVVQDDANALGLGVAVLGFTVGGMHPPVAVAASYEGVVSAQIRKVTAVVNAQVFRNRTLPAAQDSVLVRTNAARAEGLQNIARAAGEAWSFRALEAQYHVAPADYLFRRRLEILEKGLAGRGFTVVDARFLRDGGELWITP